MLASSPSFVNSFNSDHRNRFDKSFEYFDTVGKECQKDPRFESVALNNDNVTKSQQNTTKRRSGQDEPTIAAKIIQLRLLTENIRQWRLRRFPDQLASAVVHRSHPDRQQKARTSPVIDSRLLQTRNMNNSPQRTRSRILEEVRNHTAFEQKTVEQIHDASMLLMMAAPGSQEESKLMKERTELTRMMQRAQNDMVVNIQLLGMKASRKSGPERRRCMIRGKTQQQEAIVSVVRQEGRLVANEAIQHELDISKKIIRRVLEDVKRVRERGSGVQFSNSLGFKVEARDDVNLRDPGDRRKNTISPSPPDNERTVGFNTPVSQEISYNTSRTKLSPEKAEGPSQPCPPASPEPQQSCVLSTRNDKAEDLQHFPSAPNDQSSEAPLENTHSALQIKAGPDDMDPNVPLCSFAWDSLELVPTACDAVMSTYDYTDGDFRPNEATTKGPNAKTKTTPSTPDDRPAEAASRWIFEPSTHVKYKNYRAAKYKAKRRAAGTRPSQ